MLRAVTLTLVTFGLGANAAVTTSFQNGESPDAGYLGVREVAIILDTGEPWRPDANYAGTVDWVDGFPTDISTLMRFDVSPIPTTATVIAVTLRVELTDATTDSYDVYALQRLWTPFEATWFVAASGVPWQTPGAQGPTDRASTSCGALTGGVGSRTIVFNTAGQQLVQGWASNPATNFGFVIQDYAQTDGLKLRSCADATLATRPRLQVITNAGTFTFQNGVVPTAYSGCTDTTIANGADPAVTNWNNTSAFEVDQGHSVWLAADLSAIPPWATVISARLNVTVYNPSAARFDFLEALRPWGETTATWYLYDGVNAWQLPGGAGTQDHGFAILATTVAPQNGPLRIDFSDAGVLLVQGWIREPASNRGMMIPEPPAPISGFAFRESQYATGSARPEWQVTWLEGRVAVTPNPAFATAGSAATVRLFRERFDDVSIASGAPAAFFSVVTSAPAQVSTDGGGWASTAMVTIPANAGQSPPFYVFSPSPGAVGLTLDAGPSWTAIGSTVFFTDGGSGPDGGDGRPGDYRVQCGCGSASAPGWAGAWVLLLLRRRASNVSAA